MDQRTADYFEACNMAERVLTCSRNAFLEMPSVSFIPARKYEPEITSWFCLQEYRAKENEEKTREACKEAASNWVKSMGPGQDGAFVLVKDGNTGGCYYGISNGVCADTFSGILPDCKTVYNGPRPMATDCNGFISGTFSGTEVANTVMRCTLDGFYVSVLVFRFPDYDAEKRIQELEENIAFLQRFESTQRVIGNATKRVETVVNEDIHNAIRILSDQMEWLKNNKGQGFVRSLIKFGTRRAQDFEVLASLLCSALTSGLQADTKYAEPLRYRKTGGTFDFEAKWSEHLSVPYADFEEDGMHVLSMQTIPDLATVCIPGTVTHPGLLVRDYFVDSDSRVLFAGENMGTGDIPFGKTKEENPVCLESSLLCCHTAIFGGAGGGKTNSVKQILRGANDRHIPFLAIEAAKKEYWELTADIAGLTVYTPGTNGKLLRINPLEPEEGTLIENQVDMLVRAIAAAHGNEHPIPEGFEGLLKLTYEKFGWNYGMLAYRDASRPFPTFKDVYDNIEEYVRLHAPYGNEVRNNLIGALTIRAERMYSGALGRVFEENRGITAREMLTSPTVIELDDFSEGAKVFLINVLMFKIQSYLAHEGRSSELRRLIVLEEAHNVFRKARMGEQDRAISNDYFEKMLAEIRASGTGLIICDQRPSVISDAVIENTAVKIIHALEEKTDRDIISAALGLSEIQCKKLRELLPGECLLSIRGKFGVNDVFVHKVNESPMTNAYCIMCPGSFNCRKAETEHIMTMFTTAELENLANKIATAPFNPNFVAQVMSTFFEKTGTALSNTKKVCFLGAVLGKYGTLCPEVQRIVVCAYSNYLMKGV